MPESDTLVILRGAGERTEEHALGLLMQQFPEVVILRMRPLAAAVRYGFRLAVEADFRWLVTCDADVLIDADCARRIAWMKAELPTECWQGIGMVDDKLIGRPRLGGLRLHRVAALAQKIPEIRDDAIRPEADLCVADPRWRRFPCVLGRHDFEQFYSDLHRKGAQHRRKHPKWLPYAARWKTSSDMDLRAAWLGWSGSPAPTWPEKPPMA